MTLLMRHPSGFPISRPPLWCIAPARAESGQALPLSDSPASAIAKSFTTRVAKRPGLCWPCVQSRRCNIDKCPTGVTTQNPARYKQLNVTDKGVRVANYQHTTIKALTELLNILGLHGLEEVQPRHIWSGASATSWHPNRLECRQI
ncbi:glutamate synthase-related protein [Pseudidiomarina sp. E22-M8]|uniref:glutamate synthase-related protein n=1 Tax=Pseudidiomarina sp. E22-M8 TaxID=3424768 RepID=UPI00403C2D2F